MPTSPPEETAPLLSAEGLETPTEERIRCKSAPSWQVRCHVLAACGDQAIALWGLGGGGARLGHQPQGEGTPAFPVISELSSKSTDGSSGCCIAMVCDVPLHNRCPFACSVDCPQACSRLIFCDRKVPMVL